MQCLGTGAQTENLETETDARQQWRSLVSSFWNGILLPSSAKWPFSRLAQQQVYLTAWPGAAVFGVELLLTASHVVEASLRLWSKSSRVGSGSQNEPRWSWEHKSVRADSRVRGQTRALTNVPSSALPNNTSRHHLSYSAKSLAKHSSLEASKTILLFLDSETSPYLENPS